MPTSSTKNESFIPNVVRIKTVKQRRDWLSPYVLLDRWNPFTAACILHGFQPGATNIATKSAEATLVLDPDNNGDLPEAYESAISHEEEIRDLTGIIAANALQQGRNDVSPAEIVAWQRMHIH